MNLCLAEVGLRKGWDGGHVDFSYINDFALMRPYFQFSTSAANLLKSLSLFFLLWM